jgi:hypothetical protein
MSLPLALFGLAVMPDFESAKRRKADIDQAALTNR